VPAPHKSRVASARVRAQIASGHHQREQSTISLAKRATADDAFTVDGSRSV
jgi:hypothetical protein